MNNIRYIPFLFLFLIAIVGCDKDEKTTASQDILSTAATSVTEISAILGGNITTTLNVVDKGICWSTSPNPTVTDDKLSGSSGAGDFTLTITPLKSGTTYYARVYVETSDGVSYGELRSFTTDGQLSMTLPFVERFRSGSDFPPKNWTLIDHDGDGKDWRQYSSTFKGARSDSYDSGEDEGLTPYNFLVSPKITVSGTNAKLEWNIGSIDDSYFEETYKVVVSEEKFTPENCTTNGKKVFEETLKAEAGETLVNRSVDISEFSGKDIYVAWVHYDSEDIYALILTDIRIGSTESPASISLPELSSVAVSNITINGADVESTIVSDGGVSITSYGFCYGVNPSPTIADNVEAVSVSASLQSIAATLSLQKSTTYYVRAYAVNTVGVFYSKDVEVVMPDYTETEIYAENFEDAPFNRGWRELDIDGDGYTWEFYEDTPSMTSDSYRGGALTPENYLVSPAIPIPSDVGVAKIIFQLASGDDTYYEEEYKVVISESKITEANYMSATVLQDYTELTEDYADKAFQDVSIDIPSSYNGKTVYIAIVHGNCSDVYYIMLRNFKVVDYRD